MTFKPVTPGNRIPPARLIMISLVVLVGFFMVYKFMSISNQKHLDPESIMKTNVDPAVNLKVAPDYDKEMAKTRKEKLQKIDRTPREYTLWSTSFHISPIYCLKHFLKNVFEKKTSIRVNIIEKSLSGHCHLTNTCARDLKVVNRESASGEHGCSLDTARNFFNAYKNDDQFNKVDLVMCDHNIAICEMYMPFDVPLVVYATTRYEVFRYGRERWQNLNTNLKLIAEKPHNTIIANNLYDSKYVTYFTGLKAPVVDSYCAYSADEGIYSTPKRTEFLIGPSHLFVGMDFFNTVFELAKKNGKDIKLSPIRSLYSHYKYSDLINHPAIIIVPYQLSVMSFFEYYRMGLPIYSPSVELLTKWHLDHKIINQKTWHMVLHHQPGQGSPLPPHKDSPTQLDPNKDADYESVKYWNSFGDLYQWPHIITFDSMEDLYNKLSTTTTEQYKEISKKMMEYNEQLADKLVEQWLEIFDKVEQKKKQGRDKYDSLDEAMSKIYGKTSSCDV